MKMEKWENKKKERKNERMEVGERVGLPRFKVHSGAQAERRIAALLCPVCMACLRCLPVTVVGVADQKHWYGAHLFFYLKRERSLTQRGRSAETRIVSRSISLAPDKDSLRFRAVRSTANR